MNVGFSKNVKEWVTSFTLEVTVNTFGFWSLSVSEEKKTVWSRSGVV